MKLKDLRITHQLNIGIGLIFLCVAILGVITWRSTDSLWQATKGLYEHQLTVRRTIEAIKVDTLSIQAQISDMNRNLDQQELEEHIKLISTYEADAHNQLDVLRAEYLGSKINIDNISNSLMLWKEIRTETIRLLREGKVDEVVSRTRLKGVDGFQAEVVKQHLSEISAFAQNQADEVYRNSQEEKNQLMLQLFIVLGALLVLLGSVGMWLKKGILTPLQELKATTKAISKGKLGARSRYASANEFGQLSAAFNSMADTIELELKGKDNLAHVSTAMLQQNALKPFCEELLKTFVQTTGSQVGAIYLLNEQKTDFEHFESIGLTPNLKVAFSASNREGEFGEALVTRQIYRLTDIPADTQLIFSTVSGDFKPKEIMTIPILNGPEVIAMISLASVQNYSTASVQLVNNIWSELTARLNSVLLMRKISEFSHKLQNTNTELEGQAKELALQADELTEQNIELEMQRKLLDEASQLKSSFMSNMSHELRTPLNSVIALASVLNRRLHGTIPDEEYSYLDVIERNGKHLLALVNDILDLARIEAGKEEITISRFSVQAMVREIVEMLGPQVQDKQILLLNQVPADSSNIYSDMSMCRHILQNIIGNAVKFTNQGVVEISAVQVGTDLQISVTDTGIGIAEDKLHYIFDEFRQVDESTSRRYGGTGLGLAIAKKYAALLRGSIAVQSRVGKGSTFTLTLPQTWNSSVTGEELQTWDSDGVDKPIGKSTGQSGQGKCILLVEDSEPAIIQMEDILTEQGYLVYVARNGKEALEQIGRTLPDAVILDLMMPEIDGFQVLQIIRSVERTALVPVLILTAKHVTKEDLKFLKGNHIFQLIRKGSIGKTSLLAAVGDMVEQSSEQKTTLELKPAPVQTPNSGRPLILVVEDNPDNMITVRALLQETYNLIEATDGQAGIDQAKLYRPALILLDISLPVMDGFQVLQELRQEESLQHIPVIALTARAMTGDKETFLDFGFDDYISKPIDDKLLDQAIRRALGAK